GGGPDAHPSDRLAQDPRRGHPPLGVRVGLRERDGRTARAGWRQRPIPAHEGYPEVRRQRREAAHPWVPGPAADPAVLPVALPVALPFAVPVAVGFAERRREQPSVATRR